MKTFMFPGQGSQAKGMGTGLFEEFRELTELADSILGYSIRELCVDDPRQELNRTQFTQPALFVVNALSYEKRVRRSGPPDFLIGHSLGEFNALLAAGCFDFETGLRLVQKRGQLMGQVRGGAMAAILNASREEIETTLLRNGLTNVDLANYNTPSQIVISGPEHEIAQAEPLFQVGKLLFYPLNTSGAFHSRYMQGVKETFRQYLRSFDLADPKLPVISNVTARPYEHGAALDALSEQISSTVRWSESVQYLMAFAALRGTSMDFEEIGFGDVLTRLHQTIQRQTSEASLAPYLNELKHRHDNRVKAPANAEKEVESWNRRYPIGTKVKSVIANGDSDVLETSTAAQVLFGHRAAIYVKGYRAYFALEEVVPVSSSG